MIVATAGHIDHGKTALVRALTGVDADRLPEEKRRGMTIDLGFAYTALPDGTVLGIVDVPGHERFVRAMVAGVAGVDTVLLIVAADDGPMPQTRKHLGIIDLLGIARGVVALTKIDRVPPERVAEVTAQIEAMLAPTSLAGAPVFPVSAIAGDGIPALSAYLAATAASLPPRLTQGGFRLSIDRAFTLAGAGLVVTGTAYSGRVGVGDRLMLSPAGIEVRVRGLHVQDRKAESGQAGDRCAVNIVAAGLEKTAIARGDWLVAGELHAPTDRADVVTRVPADAARVFADGTPVHLHHGAGDIPARARVLGGPSLAAGVEGLVRIALDRPAALLAGDRFVLRDQSGRQTLAGGRVVDPFPPPRGRARSDRMAALAALSEADPVAALAALLDATPGGVDLHRFFLARNLDSPAREAVLASVPMQRAGDMALAPRHWQALGTRLLAALAMAHKGQPDRLGPDAGTLRRTAGGPAGPAVVAAVLAVMQAEGRVSATGVWWRLPTHKPALQPADAALWRDIEPLFAAAGNAPPVANEIAKLLRATPDRVMSVLRRAERLGLVVRIGRNRFAPTETAAQWARTAERLARAGNLQPTNFRDELAIGRNLSVEILEYLDRVGMTRREGEGRLLLRPASSLLAAAQRPDSNLLPKGEGSRT